MEGLNKLTPEQIKELSNETGLELAKLLNSLVGKANKLMKKKKIPLKIKVQYAFELDQTNE